MRNMDVSKFSDHPYNSINSINSINNVPSNNGGLVPKQSGTSHIDRL